MLSIGFLMIGVWYSQTSRAANLLYGLTVLLIILVIIVVLPDMPPLPYSVDSLPYLLNNRVIAHVLYHMMEKVKTTDLVFIGFLFMGLSQYTDSIDTLQSGEVTSLLAQIIRLVSPVIFFAGSLPLRVLSGAVSKEA